MCYRFIFVTMTIMQLSQTGFILSAGRAKGNHYYYINFTAMFEHLVFKTSKKRIIMSTYFLIEAESSLSVNVTVQTPSVHQGPGGSHKQAGGYTVEDKNIRMQIQFNQTLLKGHMMRRVSATMAYRLESP